MCVGSAGTGSYDEPVHWSHIFHLSIEVETLGLFPLVTSGISCGVVLFIHEQVETLGLFPLSGW